jgi:diaminopimelate decarboxylase
MMMSMNMTNSQYEVGGLSLAGMAQEFGTPLYVYHGEKIEEQYKKLYNSFSGVNLKLKYAAKALTNVNILKVIKNTGCGFDAVCINEVKLALQVGFAPKDIIYTPNCVHFSEVEEAIALGVHINIDSLPFFEKIGEKYGHDLPICLRINPHIQAGGNANIQVGHVGSKFGISYLQFDEILDVVEKYNLHIIGLHIHTGSDILDADVFLKGAHVLFEIAEHFKELQFLDFGSGFKVAYKTDDNTTDLEEVGTKMSQAFQDFCKAYGRELEIWFEPGKFLVSEAGTFLVNANLIKITPACTFIGVDSGFNHLIRPMMYDSYHQIINISNPNGKKKVYNVVGNICETDTFAQERAIEEAHEGDVLAFKNAGAYGFEMSSNFNSRLKPAEVLVYKGKAHVIRKRQIFEDLLRDQVDVAL